MLFLSTYSNKIDKKGRVSVPAPYRAVLLEQKSGGMMAYPSLMHGCIEACGMDRFAKLNERIERFDPFSEERDAFTATIFGESMQLAFDSEGRVTLPENLLVVAGISEQAIFVGKGETFEIWEPTAFKDYAAKARAMVLERKHMLKGGEGL